MSMVMIASAYEVPLRINAEVHREALRHNARKHLKLDEFAVFTSPGT